MHLIILSDQSFFRLLLPVLTELNVASQVVLINNLLELSEVSDDLKNQSRLLSIFSSEIVPEVTLEKFGFGCYNLHPGTSEYPGWRAWSFAILNNADHFGLTLHEMSKKVDEGPIVHMVKIPRDLKSSEQDFFNNVGDYVYEFFRSFPEFFLNQKRLATIDLNWNQVKFRKKDVQEIIKLDPSISIYELIPLIRAFGFGYLGEKPFVLKNDRKYTLGPSMDGAFGSDDHLTIYGFNFWSEDVLKKQGFSVC